MNTGRTCLPRCGAGTVSGPLLTGMGSTGASTVAVEFVAGLEKKARMFSGGTSGSMMCVGESMRPPRLFIFGNCSGTPLHRRGTTKNAKRAKMVVVVLWRFRVCVAFLLMNRNGSGSLGTSAIPG
jgi:hypothetical protein